MNYMNEFRILYLGDIVGEPGLKSVFTGLGKLKKNAHMIAVNGENAANGFGMRPQDIEQLFGLGIHVISSGNHIWQRDTVYPLLDSESNLLRPINFPSSVPGHGSVIIDVAGISVAFINILGQIRMGMTVDCPFKAAKNAVHSLRAKTKCIIVDFHAEDVREKEAMFHYLDGLVSAVVGTHTHVSTADERILPGGTAVVTDLGMCGPVGSVIGMDPELSIRRFTTQIPLKMEVYDAPGEINGVLIGIDPVKGIARSIKRISAL